MGDRTMMKKMISVDKALTMDRGEVYKLYKNHANSSLANLLSLLDMNRNYVRAQECKVWDEDGNEYLDILAGYGSLNLGHNPFEIIEALEKVKNLPNILQSTTPPMAAAAAANLALIAPGNLSAVSFCNSGAEAVEGAIKLAKIATGKDKIAFCQHSFHGKTMGALGVMGEEKYRKPFGSTMPNTYGVSFGSIEELEKVLQFKDVAAFILEPIQGEGGIVLPPEGYLQAVRDLCNQYDCLLIFDEIQTGLGRTGKMFACEHYNVVPDIMCIAKSLSGGIMPIGAVITTENLWKKAYGGIENCLLHTSTFGGNTWSTTAATATIEMLLSKDIIEQVEEKGKYILDKLSKLKEENPIIRDVRGLGLLIGIEFEEKQKGITNKITGGKMNQISENYMGSMIVGELLNKHNIISAYTLNNPNVVRFEPPLTISYEDIDYALSAIESVCKDNGSFLKLGLSTVKTAAKSIIHR
ncbi:aspartate aminotransferase family protein [Irregularibacter muris]|uniref:Aspartate aminotransferase family protein n=1 Tax=Irregularibacter muris TaxID=1796619 RepID=A0AAE3HEE0_9FIRM|nr:aspartate aminotransferase family protein [Irregularibacter muris]MCR1897954.1 aspartate aminotransferase family protein [Irregularibacter muris]